MPNLNPSELIDPLPIRMLRQSGASQESLAEICGMFYQNIEGALEKIRALLATLNDEAKIVGAMDELLHRVRGGCVTIGAEMLASELQALSQIRDRQAMHAQLRLVEQVFHVTYAALQNLVQEVQT